MFAISGIKYKLKKVPKFPKTDVFVPARLNE